MFEKKCANCGDIIEVEKNITSWKCSVCGQQNPKVNPLLTAVIFLVLMYFFLQFMFWVFGV